MLQWTRDLDSTLRSVPGHECSIMMGNFSSKIELSEIVAQLNQTIDKHLLGYRNDLSISSNPFFQQITRPQNLEKLIDPGKAKGRGHLQDEWIKYNELRRAEDQDEWRDNKITKINKNSLNSTLLFKNYYKEEKVL